MLAVSNYHYIRADFSAPFPSIYGQTPESFKKQLQAIKTYGTFIHPDEFLVNPTSYLASKKLYFLITFDDGLREQYELAKPILDDLDIPALYFVNSINFIEKKVSQVHKIHILRSKYAPRKFLQLINQYASSNNYALSKVDYQKAIKHYNYDTPESAEIKYILNFKMSLEEKSKIIDSIFNTLEVEQEIAEALYMDINQLQELGSKGLLGSHTHSHLPLGQLKRGHIEIEFRQTKNYLESLIQKPILYVSYPYGNEESCKSPVATVGKLAGHQIGFTMERGINTGAEDLLSLKRLDCNDLPLGKNEIFFKNAYRTLY